MEINKEEIKSKAEKLAQFLGYNTLSVNLDVINVQEAYCQGYLQAIKDMEITSKGGE